MPATAATSLAVKECETTLGIDALLDTVLSRSGMSPHATGRSFKNVLHHAAASPYSSRCSQ